MSGFTQKFKVQSVEKALSRRPEQTLKEIAENLAIGRSTLQTWIKLAKNNQLEKSAPMSKEKSPQDWTKPQRFEAITHCHHLNDEQTSAYCRENGLYPHHLKEWTSAFLLDKQTVEQSAKEERKQLKQENKRLQKELNRKEKALCETAALLVLSKKCQAIWVEKEGE